MRWQLRNCCWTAGTRPSAATAAFTSSAGSSSSGGSATPWSIAANFAHRHPQHCSAGMLGSSRLSCLLATWWPSATSGSFGLGVGGTEQTES